MTDNLTKQITTMIETITTQRSATPIEKSVIGLLSDCRHEVDLANAEIERLREALLEIAEGDRPDNDEQFCVGYWGATARAVLEGKKE